MGGGFVSKEKLTCATTGGPKYFIRGFIKDWITGGSFPGYKSIFDYLHMIDVKLIITLTIEPIKIGRNINHVPHEHKRTEWINSDLTEEDLTKFTIVHIPISDTHGPTPENVDLLMDVISKFRDQYPTGKAYIHCWQGRGRTNTIIMYLLMQLYGETYDDAYSEIQMKFLKGESLSVNEIIDSQPIVKTPSDHACYNKDDI